MSNPYNTNQPNVAQQYLRQQIEQAGPVEQVIMLYDGAMKFLTQARTAIENGEIEARCNANRRAMEIVAYLLDMVNPETGGEAGKKLFGIYSSLLRRMLQIDFENSIAVCDEVTGNIRSLRVGMAQALTQANAQKGSMGAGTVVAAPTAEAPAGGVRRGAVA